MGNVTLLDCTLRDGTHINNGNFGENVIKGTIDNLVKANIDIIEIGFWDNEKHNSDYTYFSSIEDVKKVLPKSLGNSKISIMADFVDMSTVEPYDGTVEYFRLSFKRSRWDWAIKSAKILMEKGYKVFINPVNCNVYSKEEGAVYRTAVKQGVYMKAENLLNTATVPEGTLVSQLPPCPYASPDGKKVFIGWSTDTTKENILVANSKGINGILYKNNDEESKNIGMAECLALSPIPANDFFCIFVANYSSYENSYYWQGAGVIHIKENLFVVPFRVCRSLWSPTCREDIPC